MRVPSITYVAISHDVIFQPLALCFTNSQWRWEWSKRMHCAPSCKWW